LASLKKYQKPVTRGPARSFFRQYRMAAAHSLERDECCPACDQQS
jgi:hypothetical protein